MFYIIILYNNKFKKTIHKYKKRYKVFVKFNKIVENKPKVSFPRRFINSNGIHPVDYKICVAKIKEKEDECGVLTDNYGRLVDNGIVGDFVILKEYKYDIEETFWFYNDDHVNSRVDVSKIIAKLRQLPNETLHQVIVIHNKLVIHSENYFNMVMCKCIDDAQRLHHFLYNKMKRDGRFIWMGTAVTQSSISYMYEIIQKNTGWKMSKIYRPRTKP